MHVIGEVKTPPRGLPLNIMTIDITRNEQREEVYSSKKVNITRKKKPTCISITLFERYKKKDIK